MGKEQKANGPKKKKNDAPRHADLYIHRFAAEVRIEGGIRSLEQTYKKNQLTPPERRRNNFSATPTSSECLVASLSGDGAEQPPRPSKCKSLQQSPQQYQRRKNKTHTRATRPIHGYVEKKQSIPTSRGKERAGIRANSETREGKREAELHRHRLQKERDGKPTEKDARREQEQEKKRQVQENSVENAKNRNIRDRNAIRKRTALKKSKRN